MQLIGDEVSEMEDASRDGMFTAPALTALGRCDDDVGSAALATLRSPLRIRSTTTRSKKINSYTSLVE